jgi:peptide/nickel transport system permease protein
MTSEATAAPVVGLERLQDSRLRQARSFLRALPKLPAAIFLVMLLAAITAPMIAPYDPNAIDLGNAYTPPFQKLSHPLGTDNIGRDMLSRLLYGAQIPFLVAAIGTVVAGVMGTAAGLASGYFGGVIDRLIMRIADALFSIPFLLIAVTLSGVIGVGLQNVLIVIAIRGWTGFARVIRSEVLRVRELDYVLAARVIGCGNQRIVWRHVLPNVAHGVIILATLDVGTLIVAESSLSFLGIGVQPPRSSWGAMLSGGRAVILDHWWLAVLPGVAIMLTVLSTSLLGDWLRDRLDPRLRHLRGV